MAVDSGGDPATYVDAIDNHAGVVQMMVYGGRVRGGGAAAVLTERTGHTTTSAPPDATGIGPTRRWPFVTV